MRLIWRLVSVIIMVGLVAAVVTTTIAALGI
jgi:hypothetical protein